jgi:hypothetical protein
MSRRRSAIVGLVGLLLGAILAISGCGGGSSSDSSTNQPVQPTTVSPALGSWSGADISFTLNQGSFLIDNLSVNYSGQITGANCSGTTYDYNHQFSSDTTIQVLDNTFTIETPVPPEGTSPELKITGKFTSATTAEVDVSWSTYNSICDAWEQGSDVYYADHQNDLSTGSANFVGSHYSGSGNCTSCHDGLNDTQGQDISIVRNWSSSMMANSTRDSYWRAKLAAELKRNPGLSHEINNACTRCHAPMANDSAQKDGAAIETFGNGFLNPINPYFNHAMDGVSCTSCHQIADDGKLGTTEGNSGAYTVLEYPNKRDRPLFGQYTGVNVWPMRMRVNFTPQYGSHILSSAMCGSCHDLKTPFVDSQGTLVSTLPETNFPEQMPFTEWSNSDYRNGGSKEKSCQSCHMPVVSDSVGIARMGGSSRTGFAQHDFRGANTTMLDILDENRTALGATSTGFATHIDRTQTFLKSAASIAIQNATVKNGVLEAQVLVTNNTGHKLPTAYPSRRAWIHFVVKDAAGQIVFESGRMNSNGSIVGAATDEDASTYEPHYQTITAEDQVQVYEPIMGDTDGNVTHTLLRAATYLKDNRLVPSGFRKLAVPGDVRVAGEAATDTDFDNGSDTVLYRVPVGPSTNLTITVELNYQGQSYGHLKDLFTDTDIPEVAAFSLMFEQRGILAETLASATSAVN